LALSGASLAVAASLHTRRPVATVTRKPGLDVLLITIDTLRADAVGRVRSTKGATPVLDRLAAEAWCSARRTRTTSSPLPPHAKHPVRPAALPAWRARQRGVSGSPPTTPTLATLLKAAGYRTGCVRERVHAPTPAFGLDRGFDVYDDQLERPAGRSALPERRGADTVAAAQRWLAQGDGRPTFCWIHVYDPHAP